MSKKFDSIHISDFFFTRYVTPFLIVLPIHNGSIYIRLFSHPHRISHEIINLPTKFLSWFYKSRSPIVASGAIRRACFRFLHVKNHVPLVLEALIVVLAGSGASWYTAGYRNRRQGWLQLLAIHPIPRLPPLQHARLFCHLDHQRLNPRCPPITTHIKHNMHYPYWPNVVWPLFLLTRRGRRRRRHHYHHHYLGSIVQKRRSLPRDTSGTNIYCGKLRRLRTDVVYVLSARNGST